MNISRLLSTEERVKILRHVMYKAGGISVSKTAAELRLSKGLISGYLGMLKSEGLLRRKGGEYFANNSMASKAIKLMLNMSAIDSGIFRKYGFVKGAGVYGSFAKGENDDESDIDIWIAVDKTKEEHLARLTAELRKAFGNVKPLYLTKEKLRLLMRKDELFYHSLVFGSITIYGDSIETIWL